MAGGVGNDEFPFGRGEITVGNVDGDALFPLGAKAVGEESEVDEAAAAVDGSLGDTGELIFVDAFGIVQKAADQGAFAVVDTAGGGEAEEAHHFRNTPRAF